MSKAPGKGPPAGGHGQAKKPANPEPAGAKKQSGAQSSRAVVPRTSGAMSRRPGASEQSIICPEGYTMRKVEPAKNYDVISFARAMNDDFGPRVQRLFEPEKDAAIAAQQTGVYIGWRCPQYTWDCQRVGVMSKCFCGHLLSEHAKYNGNSVMVPCKQAGCKCKGFAWIPSRPEDVGEFWHQRRRDFDPSTWRAKCRCKHTHEEHEPTAYRRCRMRGCGCMQFDSNFLCAACDKHWEEHETFFDTTASRKEKGLPVGDEYLPFAEIPSLRNMVLTGEDDGDMSYINMQQQRQALPSSQPADNNTPVPFGGHKKSSFRPTYD